MTLDSDYGDDPAERRRQFATRQFGEYELRAVRAKRPDEWEPRHIIEAHHPQAEHMVGRMAWNSDEILRIEVAPEHRRQGLATAMWNMGQQFKTKPKHSADRDDDGDAWARAVGGELP